MVKVGITKIQIEEDAAKSIHAEHESLINYNRASIPLIEIISEPDMRSSEEAYEYLNTLKSTIKYTGISDVSMELGSLRCDANISVMEKGSKFYGTRVEVKNLNSFKAVARAIGISDVSMELGSLRCDANISVMEKGSKFYGTRVEVKNLNSFKAVARAIDYEIGRQIETIENGGEIHQETRLWDEESQTTKVMRSKEEAMDYRYFPEPDLLKLVITDEEVEAIRELMPESKTDKLNRFINDYKIPEYDANILCEYIELAYYF